MSKKTIFVASRCNWCGVYCSPLDLDSRGMCDACTHHHGEPPSGECRACNRDVDALYEGYCTDCWEAIEEEVWDQ